MRKKVLKRRNGGTPSEKRGKPVDKKSVSKAFLEDQKHTKLSTKDT